MVHPATQGTGGPTFRRRPGARPSNPLPPSRHRYVKAVQSISLSKFCGDVLTGRQHITLECPPTTVALDPIACSIVLDNAIMNAHRHGCPDGPELRLTVDVADAGPDLEVTFTLRNRANPRRAALAPWSAADAPAARPGPPRTPHDAVSDGLGLQHIALVVASCGMGARLWQEGAFVYFTLSLLAKASAEASAAGAPAALPSSGPGFPESVSIVCLDDSALARKALGAVLPSKIPGANVQVRAWTLQPLSVTRCRVTDGRCRVTDGGWRVTDGGRRVTDGRWRVTDGGRRVADGGRRVTDAVGG